MLCIKKKLDTEKLMHVQGTASYVHAYVTSEASKVPYINSNSQTISLNTPPVP